MRSLAVEFWPGEQVRMHRWRQLIPLQGKKLTSPGKSRVGLNTLLPAPLQRVPLSWHLHWSCDFSIELQLLTNQSHRAFGKHVGHSGHSEDSCVGGSTIGCRKRKAQRSCNKGQCQLRSLGPWKPDTVRKAQWPHCYPLLEFPGAQCPVVNTMEEQS